MQERLSKYNDVIDSRDVIARIEELSAEREDLIEEQTDLEGGQELWALTEFNESEKGEELAALVKLAEQASAAEDWEHGVALVRYSYFVSYARELVQDVGDLPDGVPDYIVVDWEATAENLKADYFEVDFDGVEYWVR